MGLRCLLGHDFGAAELKRDREEQGEEVVVTVSEQQTCTRCGATRIVSENTEVTSIQQLTETADDEAAATPTADDAAETTPGADVKADDGDTDTAQPPTAETATANEPTPATDDGVTITDDAELLTDESTPTSEEPADTAEAATGSETDDSTAEASATEPTEEPTDDGVILSEDTDSDTTEPSEATGAASEAESSGDDRATGEWPSYEGDSQPGAEPTAWPDQQGEDDGFDATAPSEAGDEGVTFSSGGGFTPEVDDSGAADRQPDADGEVIEEPEELTKADDASVYEPTVDDINTEFYCPECGFSRASGASSMRAGDICPECRRGYIAERRQE